MSSTRPSSSEIITKRAVRKTGKVSEAKKPEEMRKMEKRNGNSRKRKRE